MKVFNINTVRKYITVMKPYMFIRHLNEIRRNFMVPFLLSLKPAYSFVVNTGNRIRINERGNRL